LLQQLAFEAAIVLTATLGVTARVALTAIGASESKQADVI
jgi:hypothetical protein